MLVTSANSILLAAALVQFCHLSAKKIVFDYVYVCVLLLATSADTVILVFYHIWFTYGNYIYNNNAVVVLIQCFGLVLIYMLSRNINCGISSSITNNVCKL